MKRTTGVLLVIILVLSFATACGNAEQMNADRSTVQGRGGFVESDAGAGGAAGTNGEQGASEAVATPLPKRGYVAESWTDMFGAEKLSKASESGIVYTLEDIPVTGFAGEAGSEPIGGKDVSPGEGDGDGGADRVGGSDRDGGADRVGGSDRDGGADRDARDPRTWYALPQLNDDTEDAALFNANMRRFADLMMKRHHIWNEGDGSKKRTGFNYVVYEHGDYVSVVLLYYFSYGSEQTAMEHSQAVVYDKKQGKFLTWEEMIAAAGAKTEDLNGLDRWFLIGDLFADEKDVTSIYLSQSTRNLAILAIPSMELVWRRLYPFPYAEFDSYPYESDLCKTMINITGETLEFPKVSLYLDDREALSVIGEHVAL